MTTERLYYTDSYATTFTARVIERVQHKGQSAAVLDRTLFYPESGGQPADTGRLHTTAVTHVTIRPTDGAVLHWLGQSDVWADQVTGEINWPRRFDHMQQHTGQHILSQAFIQIARAETVGFHLTDNSLTIDLHTNQLTPAQIQDAETSANEIIWQNRPITVRFVTLAEAKTLPLRKLPPIENGKLRLVDIADFDLTACGGTHVAQTGAVGQIKIIRLERRGDQLRVHFACGQRALHDYRQKNSIVSQLAGALTTGNDEIVTAVTRQQEDLKNAQRLLRKQRDQLLQVMANDLLTSAAAKNGVRVVTHVFSEDEADAAQLRTLGSLLTANANTVALLGLSGAKTVLLFGRADDTPGHMGQLLKSALQLLEGGGGGGSPTFAQGGGPSISSERLSQILARAERLLLGQI